MSRSILLLGTAKASSTRMKDKMTRPFAGTTMMALYVKLFDELRMSGLFDEAVMAIPTSDHELREIAAGLPIYGERPRDRTHSCPRNEQLYYLKEYKEDYVLWLNGCLPLLRADTVRGAVAWFLKDGDCQSLTTVKEAHNWYWTRIGQNPVNNIDSQCCSTRTCTPLLESTHAFHIFSRERMLRYGAYWGFGPRDPYLYLMKDPRECLDVHTHLDFALAEMTYQWRAHANSS